MSTIKIQPNSAGSGTFSLASPSSNVSRTLTLPDSTGVLLNDLSSLASNKLTGALPAIDGSALTGLPSGAHEIWFPSSWTSPNASYTSSTTWTKPAAVTDAHTVWFYMIGGGGGGGYPSEGREDGGAGGAAMLVCASGASLPSSVTLTIGAGGAAGDYGGNTSITVNGVPFNALGGPRGNNNLGAGSERNGSNGSTYGRNLTAAHSNGALGIAYDFSVFGYFGAGGGRKNSDGGGNIAGGFLGGSGGTRWNNGNAPGGGGGAEGSGANGAIYIFWGLA